MPLDQIHRRAAHDFTAGLVQRAGYSEHFKRPVLHTSGEKATVSLQKRNPDQAIPKRLLEGIERLARQAAAQHRVKFGKELEVEKGRHSIVFRAAK